MKQRELEQLSVLGGTALVVACAPTPPATIEVHETREPEPAPRVERPDKPEASLDRTPPKVLRAEFVGEDRLRIHFSEPIIVGAHFDPRDFRISRFNLYYFPEDIDESRAFYDDIGNFYSGKPLVFSGGRVRGAILELDFRPEFELRLCHRFNYDVYGYPVYGDHVYIDHLSSDHAYEAPGYGSLFLHYAASSIPICDEAGNPLADFGAQWVAAGREEPPRSALTLTGAAAAEAGAGRVQIACQPKIPRGPR